MGKKKEKININLKKKSLGVSLAGTGVVLEVLSSGVDVIDLFIPKEKSIIIETSLGKKKTNDIVKIQFKDREENEYVKFMYLVENHKKNESHYDVYRGITEYNLTYEFSNTNNRGIVYDEGVFSNGSREVFSDGAVGSVSVFNDYNKTLDEVKEVEQNGYKEKSIIIETSLGKKKTNDIVKIQFKDREENEYVKFMYLVENHKKNESHYDVYRGITEYNLTYEFSNTNNRGIVYDEGVFSNGSREVFSDGAVGSVSVFDDYNKTLDEVKEVEQNGYKEHKVEEHQEYNYSNATKDYLDSFNYYMNILGDNISEEDYSNSIDYLEQNGFFDSLGNSADILNSVYGEYGSYFGFVEEETESHSR